MVNMSPLPDDVYTRADTALYQDLSRKDVLTLFVYNQHLYFDGERKFIDENSSQVRTEMRRNTVVAPLTVFSFFEGIRVNGSCVVCGDKTVDLGECDFHIAPFEHLGHLYVPVKETAETLGLCAVCAYLGRVVAIGREEKIKEISDAFRKNENLAVKIKVCEPTNKADSLELIIDRRLKLLSADNRFDAVCGEKTKLILNTANSYGEGYEALFMPD